MDEEKIDSSCFPLDVPNMQEMPDKYWFKWDAEHVWKEMFAKTWNGMLAQVEKLSMVIA